MVANSILRQNARAQLGGKLFAEHWLMMVVVYLIYSAISGAAGYIGFGIAGIIVAGPLMFGVLRVLINRAKGKPNVDIGEMFCGFSECFGGSIVLSLLTALFTFLWTMLFVIPGMVKTYSYAMAPYIQQDDPQKDAKTCIDESRAMMRGYKGQLFALDMSFIGWYILGTLCFGIGLLFVYPYHMQARANFYLALKAANEQPAFDVQV